MWHFQFFCEKNTSPKWRSRKWLEIAQKLFHQRVGDEILRRKFGSHLSSISNNKGATAPRKLPYGLRLFQKIFFWTCTFFEKFCFFAISRLSSTYQNPDCVKTACFISLKFCRRLRIKNQRVGCNSSFLIASAILDLFGVLWKTLDLNSVAILNRIVSQFGMVIGAAKFSGSFLIDEKIFVNVATRWPQSFVFGRFWRVVAAILDSLETWFLALMVAADRGYAAPHRMNPSLKWAWNHRPPKCDIFNFFAKKIQVQNGDLGNG